MTELWKHGASELAEMIRAGKVSSVEVVEAHLARIEAVNGSLNAMVKVLGEQAVTRASEIDAALARDEKLGPLAGVPFTVKENIDYAGLPTTSPYAARQTTMCSKKGLQICVLPKRNHWTLNITPTQKTALNA